MTVGYCRRCGDYVEHVEEPGRLVNRQLPRWVARCESGCWRTQPALTALDAHRVALRDGYAVEARKRPEYRPVCRVCSRDVEYRRESTASDCVARCPSGCWETKLAKNERQAVRAAVLANLVVCYG